MIIRAATEADHDALVRICRRYPYTASFTNRVMFSTTAAYEKGWIVLAEDDFSQDNRGAALGFYCVRHKVREPYTMLYYLAAFPTGRQTGAMLVEHMKSHSPHGRVELNVAKDNGGAVSFYQRHGFLISGEALGGAGYRMSWQRKGDPA